MAEAIAKQIASDIIEPSSAGLVAFGEITRPTLAVLEEHGISAAGQRSKTLRPEHMSETDLLINMSGRSTAAIFDGPLPPAEDWDVGDPFGLDLAIYRNIRDQIEARVQDLALRLRKRADANENVPVSRDEAGPDLDMDPKAKTDAA
jgi:protein-tyrosine-phosphatase